MSLPRCPRCAAADRREAELVTQYRKARAYTLNLMRLAESFGLNVTAAPLPRDPLVRDLLFVLLRRRYGCQITHPEGPELYYLEWSREVGMRRCA